MKKVLCVLLLSIFALFEGFAVTHRTTLEDVWREFRQNHPFGFQSVGLKHLGEECVFVISEPSESISKDELSELFNRYDGTIMVKHSPFGYDGWLADVVGNVKFANDTQESDFKRELFSLLYGTDYKSYYVDLDHPTTNTYTFFAPYKYQLNYSISVADLESWFIGDKAEKFGKLSGNVVSGADKSVKVLMSMPLTQSNQLYYSDNRGFVAWVVNPQMMSESDPEFRKNARHFVLDTDLIIGAFGIKGKNIVIIGREREIPVSILPPLRIETLTLLATTRNESLAQSYERYNIFANKLPGNEDVAPIYLSDELWHSEYGNLLNVTDQMLKSWSENGRIDYKNFGHPKPIDWAFNRGAVRDLGASELTYNWNTAGAGFVVKGDAYDVIAVNRTGSLPVSYIPGGMEGRVEQEVYDAEEMAYDFFSGLNSPALARVVQYATFYQIFNYFKDGRKTTQQTLSTENNVVPNYRIFDKYVEHLLRVAGQDVLSNDSKEYQDALSRFSKRYLEMNAHKQLLELIKNDPYGEFKSYLYASRDSLLIDSLLNNPPTVRQIEDVFQSYLNSNMDSIQAYIKSYEKRYGDFPYEEAARYVVSPRELNNKINGVKAVEGIEEYERRVDEYNIGVDRLKKEATSLLLDIAEFNKKVDAGKASFIEKSALTLRERVLSERSDSLERVRTEIDKEEARILSSAKQRDKVVEPLLALMMNDRQQKAMGALNWLLTDPTPYEVPSGPFFASQLTSHKQWTKSPSMACSTNKSGYGGHNLDAHLTPIEKASSKIASQLRSGYGRISFRNGKPVIFAAEKDMRRITPDFLRKVERQIITEQDIKLPEAPKGKPKSILIAEDLSKKGRGFNNLEQRHDILSTTSNAPIKLNSEIASNADLRAELKELGEDIHSLHIEPLSERDILVQNGDKAFIVQRADDYTYNWGNQEVHGKVQKGKFVLELQPTLKDDFIQEIQSATILSLPERCSQYSEYILEKIRSILPSVNNLFKLKWYFKKAVVEDNIIPADLLQDMEIDMRRGVYLQEFDSESIDPTIYTYIYDYDELIFIPAA